MGGRGVALLTGVIALALVGVGGWWFLFGGSDPPPVSLEQAVTSLQATPAATSAAARATPSVVAATIPSATASPAAAAPKSTGDVASRWVVDGSNSFVGYRMVEQLASIGANTAVGRTSAVTGELRYDGGSVTALQVQADVRQLKSDDNRRDNFLRTQSLQTSQFPEAKFVLTEPIAISVRPAEGAAMTTTARGDLTLHGVTKRVDVPLEGKMANGKLVVVGSTRIALADYAISPPRAPVVLSVEDAGVMELSLVFAPEG
ncbi:MAG: YceI family protein [Dehalococcoidia bacterium]